jgi:hypothetical protein
MTIYNLTQHPATAEQIEAGVVDLPPEYREELGALLTFEECPTCEQVEHRAEQIGDLFARYMGNGEPTHPAVFVALRAAGEDVRAMIGGAPFLMAHLEYELIANGITPVYAFSRRESVEEALADGSVRKSSVFRHAGFVLGCYQEP